jgi:P-type Mg2+ transporter
MNFPATGIDTNRASVRPGSSPRSSLRWLSWVSGVVMVAAVVVAALHFAEARELARIAEDAQPWWLALAVMLQLATYVAAAQVFRRVVRAGGHSLNVATGCRLSLMKLFVDQAVPSAGLSGTVVLADGLERRGIPRPVVAAGIVVELASYYGAYVLSLVLALVVSARRGEVSTIVWLVSLVFFAFALGLTAVILALSGRRTRVLPRPLMRVRPLATAIGFIEQADPELARSPRLLVQSGVCQLAVVLCDAATVWVLIRALGAYGSPSGVFASFMISSLLRTIGFMPGGLGLFEAASVLTLHMVGVPTTVALAATVLFRGLSFWLPMLPGLWFSRRAISRAPSAPVESIGTYWAIEPAALLVRLGTSVQGISSAEAAERLRRFGTNQLERERSLTRVRVLWNQLRSPLLLLLLFAAVVSGVTGEWRDALIVGAIVLATVSIGYKREYSAQSAVAALYVRAKTHSNVLRDGQAKQVPLEEIVPGDVVLLSAGSLVPADGVVLEARDCHVSEAALTGESFPVEKEPGTSQPTTPLSRRTNCVFLGTNVRSGTARCLIITTGPATEFGSIAKRLVLRPPDTEFDRGIRHFGYLLTSVMLIMVLVVFVAHMFLGRSLVETLLFAIALAVGLSPELLPAILSFNLARGAKLMASRGVLVRRLPAIENLGSMDILCTDKTGTLTEGVVELEGAYDETGAKSDDVLELGAVNAALETGLPSPLDDAIVKARTPNLSQLRKVAEIPFDFVRKRVSVIVEGEGGLRLVTKGAFHRVLDDCSRMSDGTALGVAQRAALERRYDEWCGRGIRVLGVAQRGMAVQAVYRREDEHDLTFAGFLTFLDRPKEGAAEALRNLARLGVSVKLISGDSKLVAQHVAGLVGLPATRVLTGSELDELHDEALWHSAERTDLFVEVDPNQKERIILSLRKMGHVVGFLGDGVNDAPAMHAADTSISVEHAVDVAKEAADFVLLERDLDVIRHGIEEGRKTFANTRKYILTTTSANLGNMVSMAAASVFLPFLPLLAGQILLNNFLSDIPAIGIADDRVDPELVECPRRWDMRFIGRFMIEFGVLSSAFDFLTFGVLLGLFHASPELFRTGWFVESLLTELVVALVVRTRRPFFRSKPGTVLLVSTMVLIPVTFAIPYVPHISVLGFVTIPPSLLVVLAGITALYVVATELMKKWFYRRA